MGEEPQFNSDDVDVKRLRLKPGDIVIVTVNERITPRQAAEIKAIVEPVVTPHRVLVMGQGIVIEIMEPSDAE